MLKPSWASGSGSLPGCSFYSWCRMRTDLLKRLPTLYSLAILGLVPTSAMAQHVHGVVELGVVVEGGTVAVSLSAPMSDVVGFEHAPKGDDQVEAIEQAAALLSDADQMFSLPGAIGCETAVTSIEGPEFVMQHLADHRSDDADHDHHDEHEHHDEEQHSEINVTYEWTCNDAAKLDALELRFIDGFADIEKIEVRVLTSAGAHVATVGGDARLVSLAP